MRKKAVIFDMDGLMFDTETLGYQAQRELAEELALPIAFDFDYYLKQVGRSDKDVMPELASDFGDAELAERFLRKMKKRQTDIASEQGLPIKKGLHDLLAFLKAEGVVCVVASSSRRREVCFYLELADISQYFRYQVCGDEVSFAKPDPEIFLSAWKPLGIPKEDCLILEDSLNGVRAAFDAGIEVIMIPDLIVPDDEAKAKTTAVLPDLHAVMDWLKEK
ncbi:HAD family hydrolase [Trichococcus ilyis]|jgi:HAD superfamily hydrolase (TIGR01509 family)|uniref:Haloacid dehalogenase superfamily, subfamily IA, variant 3 with third motif having DD or ED n=1 Tax=Trichococcus ilyis TaxID=640938 RepID=A0A143YY45_9LACT|nr:HAD family phosphatase [Trichococcus ilyis]CZR01538.1 Hypothetical protein TR210_1821 [Trichococcus ilyis]SEJ25280.1 haloacid dehalogenase superfamily, subfamily IA, variant 3 with third motif having DD or ED [Trichococcus ilyis]